MVGHHVVLVSFLVVVDLAYQVVDHASESLALALPDLDQALLDLAQALLVHETSEEVLC